MTADNKGLLIGDKGYIRLLLSEELKWQDIDLQTTLRKNMKDSRDKNLVKQLMSAQRLIETVIGQLSERFHIECVISDTPKIASSVSWVHRTVGGFLNYPLGQQLLQFKALVQQNWNTSSQTGVREREKIHFIIPLSIFNPTPD